MRNISTFLEDGAAVTQCILIGSQDWSYITITHMLPSGVNVVVANTSKSGDAKTVDRIHMDVIWNSSYVGVILNFTRVRCGDEGVYRCQVHGSHPEQISDGHMTVVGKTIYEYIKLLIS